MATAFFDDDLTLQRLLNFEPLIRKVARLLKARYQDHEDALQAGRLGLLIAHRAFDSSRGLSFGAFAYPYVLGEMRRALYRGVAPNSVDLDAEVIETLTVSGLQEQLVLKAQSSHAVRRFISSIPALERQAVVDRLWREQSQSVTAKRSGISQPAVHKAWTRALRKGASALHNFETAA